MRGRLDGRLRTGASRLCWEESPDSMKQRCRVTPGQGNLRESATENRPLYVSLAGHRVRVKRCGKSAPRDGQPDRHGKPHLEQCRIGMLRECDRVTDILAGPLQPRHPGWQLEGTG
jgi:hypothetical protein